MVRWHFYRILLLSYLIMYYSTLFLVGFGCGMYYNMFLFVKGAPRVWAGICIYWAQNTDETHMTVATSHWVRGQVELY